MQESWIQGVKIPKRKERKGKTKVGGKGKRAPSVKKQEKKKKKKRKKKKQKGGGGKGGGGGGGGGGGKKNEWKGGHSKLAEIKKIQILFNIDWTHKRERAFR